jgi:hypothetical protein
LDIGCRTFGHPLSSITNCDADSYARIDRNCDRDSYTYGSDHT